MAGLAHASKDELEGRPEAIAMPSVLIVDDDPDFQAAMAEIVRSEGFEVETAGSLADAHAIFKVRVPDVVLVDLTLPDGNGLELLTALEGPGAPEMIVISGHATLDNAIEALRQGASDYLTKPVDLPRLRAILVNVARRRDMTEEIEGLRAELRGLGRFGALIGGSPVMQTVYEQITRVAPSSATVFIQGESGTGKELVAESVHKLSRRRKRPFVVINCGAIAPNLIESELFGHERGSFTGADRLHRGYIERANGGTLFLDEVTEMPLELQVKLLRVLETGRFSRVGGEQELPVDVRVIAATNRDPHQAVIDQKFREDLLYRLRVFPITLPPLRDRAGELEREAELLHTDAKNGLDYTVARRSEQLARQSYAMSVSAHRLNMLAALFFPFSTIYLFFAVPMPMFPISMPSLNGSPAHALQAAYLAAVYQAVRAGRADGLAGTPGEQWLSRVPPWLRAVLAVPNRPPEHARRLFPSGAAPRSVERFLDAGPGSAGELAARFSAAIASAGDI